MMNDRIGTPTYYAALEYTTRKLNHREARKERLAGAFLISVDVILAVLAYRILFHG